jgi:rRNA maturation endonuclease Nob1
MKNPLETSVWPGREWQLIERIQCVQCGKRFAVAMWRSSAKCRECGAELRPAPPPAKSPNGPEGNQHR